MNRLFCFLTGGHRYADTGLTARSQTNPDLCILHNECIKCGKAFEFELNIGAIIRADIAKRQEETAKTYFSPEEVRKMSPREVRDNYQAIMNSMKEWK